MIPIEDCKTFDNIKVILKDINNKWELNNKIVLGITDNEITGCIEQMNITTITCFLHTN